MSAFPMSPAQTSEQSTPRNSRFQCGLCPKKYTKRHDLREHFRTHSGERPFVCNICGTAFTRRRDYRRHESQHSGEKKFVCGGTLESGDRWGCGIKFARPDALKAHFRSDSGKQCMRPVLLGKERAKRSRRNQSSPTAPRQIASSIDHDVSIPEIRAIPSASSSATSNSAALMLSDIFISIPSVPRKTEAILDRNARHYSTRWKCYICPNPHLVYEGYDAFVRHAKEVHPHRLDGGCPVTSPMDQLRTHCDPNSSSISGAEPGFGDC